MRITLDHNFCVDCKRSSKVSPSNYFVVAIKTNNKLPKNKIIIFLKRKHRIWLSFLLLHIVSIYFDRLYIGRIIDLM